LVDWARVAAASAEIVESGSKTDEHIASWRAAGQRVGLRGIELLAFESLYVNPIDVRPDIWINSIHRAYLIQQAGSGRVATVNPEWLSD